MINGDGPGDYETLMLHGVYSADAEINGVSQCKGISVPVALGS